MLVLGIADAWESYIYEIQRVCAGRGGPPHREAKELSSLSSIIRLPYNALSLSADLPEKFEQEERPAS